MLKLSLHGVFHLNNYKYSYHNACFLYPHRSIGYQSTPIDDHAVVPFDDQSCTIPNERGRVTGRTGE